MPAPLVLTETIAVAAPPGDVLGLIADPRQLPRWAPGFAEEIREDGEDWIVTAGDDQRRIHVAVSRGLGTVDILARTDDDRLVPRAFSRVIPVGGGSMYMFTLLLPESISAPALEQQQAVVRGELETVRRLVEDRPG